MAFLELINMRKVRKALLYLLCILAALWLQTMIFSRAFLFGVKPMYIPALAVAIGFFEGGVWGGMLGLAAGAYCDMCYSDSTVLFLVLFTALGFLSGLLTEFFINRSFVSYLILSALALLLTAFCQITPLWIFQGAALRPLAITALLQSALSLPFAVVIYFIVRAIAGRERDRTAAPGAN